LLLDLVTEVGEKKIPRHLNPSAAGRKRKKKKRGGGKTKKKGGVPPLSRREIT